MKPLQFILTAVLLGSMMLTGNPAVSAIGPKPAARRRSLLRSAP